MHRILVTASFPAWQMLRQTPLAAGRWEDCQFLFEPVGDPVDGWVVYDNLNEPQSQLCPPANTLLITGEPQSVRRYRSRFTGQFAHVWTSHSDIAHHHVLRCNEAQPWHYGMRHSKVHGAPLTFDKLAALPRPAKPKLLSVVCSGKTTTPDQRQRLEFTRRLKEELGDVIDVFGRDSRPVDDKADAIWDYKYHVVLENDHSPYFMTEKLADAFLGWSYPLYFGGPEANHRFPAGSFTAIDIYQPDQAVAMIRDILASNTYEASLEALANARHQVLHHNNIMALLARFWRERLVEQRPAQVGLLPKSHRTQLVLRQVQRMVGPAAWHLPSSVRRAA